MTQVQVVRNVRYARLGTNTDNNLARCVILFFWIDEYRLTQTPGPVSQSLWLLSHSFFDVLANGGHLMLRSEQNGIAFTGTLRIAKKIYYNDNWHVIIPKLVYS